MARRIAELDYVGQRAATAGIVSAHSDAVPTLRRVRNRPAAPRRDARDGTAAQSGGAVLVQPAASDGKPAAGDRRKGRRRDGERGRLELTWRVTSPSFMASPTSPRPRTSLRSGAAPLAKAAPRRCG